MYKKKDFSWKFMVVDRVLECAATGQVPDVQLPASHEMEVALRPTSEYTKVGII